MPLFRCHGATHALASASFDMHAELAATLGHDVIGYRRLSTLQAQVGGSTKEPHPVPTPTWLEQGLQCKVRSVQSPLIQ